MKCDVYPVSQVKKRKNHGRTNVSNYAESRGKLVLLGFWEYGTHNII